MDLMDILKALANSTQFTSDLIRLYFADIKLELVHQLTDDALGAYAEDTATIKLCPYNIWMCAVEEKLDYDYLLVRVLSHEFRHAQQFVDEALPATDTYAYSNPDGTVDFDKWEADRGEIDAADYANAVMKHIHKSTMSYISGYINYKWRTQLLG